MKPLIIHPEAAWELEEAVVYHEQRVEGMGQELRAEIERAFDRLLVAPQLCPPHRRTGFRKCFVARFQYTISFLDLPEAIWVAAVAHGKRRPGYWNTRAQTDDQPIET